MKTLNTIIAVIIWLGGLIAGIVIGFVGAESFGLGLLYWVSAFIIGSLFMSLSVILGNQERLQGRVGSAESGIKDLRKIVENGIAPKAEASQSAASPERQQTARSQLTANGWKCKKCGTDNPRSSVICSNCGAYK